MQPGPNDEYDRVLAGMMRSHVLGKDICLVGGKGSGKTIVGDFVLLCMLRLTNAALACLPEVSIKIKQLDHLGRVLIRSFFYSVLI